MIEKCKSESDTLLKFAKLEHELNSLLSSTQKPSNKNGIGHKQNNFVKKNQTISFKAKDNWNGPSSYCGKKGHKKFISPIKELTLMLLKTHIFFIKELMLDKFGLSKELDLQTWLIPNMTKNLTSGLAERFRMLFFRYLANGFLIVKV